MEQGEKGGPAAFAPPLQVAPVGDSEPRLDLLVACVGGMLLIGCGNVTGLAPDKWPLLKSKSGSQQSGPPARATLCVHQIHFKPNWMRRGLPADEILPKVAEPRKLSGKSKLVWFSALKNSARN